MDKRYQVFVSSTFTDLQNVRAEIFKTLMSLDCIPAGMENFPAMDLEQFEFIKTIIDDCDYYLIIVGGRYGTPSPSGVSYTELEYDYAVSKGMKVIAFLHDDIGSLPSRDTEAEPALRTKLEAFREKLKSGRLVKFWKSADELNAHVATSLMQTIKIYPAVGWVRANRVTSEESLQELNDLRKELEVLRAKSVASEVPKPLVPNLAGLEAQVVVRLKGSGPFYQDDSIATVTTTWGEIFARMAPIVQVEPSDAAVSSALAKLLWPKNQPYTQFIQFLDDDFGRIRIQFIALGLIEVSQEMTSKGNSSSKLRLTQSGLAAMFRLVAAQDAEPS